MQLVLHRHTLDSRFFLKILVQFSKSGLSLVTNPGQAIILRFKVGAAHAIQF